jgi:hypothetical protein
MKFRLLRFDRHAKYPVGDRLFYRCSVCGDYLASATAASCKCSCGNIEIDVFTGTLTEHKKGSAWLIRKIA